MKVGFPTYVKSVPYDVLLLLFFNGVAKLFTWSHSCLPFVFGKCATHFPVEAIYFQVFSYQTLSNKNSWSQLQRDMRKSNLWKWMEFISRTSWNGNFNFIGEHLYLVGTFYISLLYHNFKYRSKGDLRPYFAKYMNTLIQNVRKDNDI